MKPRCCYAMGAVVAGTTFFLHSPLAEIPHEEEVWVCPECIRDGITKTFL
jgi:hypothetical protein